MSSHTLAERASSGRCVQCNHECVGAWLCYACAITGGAYREPPEYRPAVTATAIGRARNRALGNATAYAIWRAVISAGSSTAGAPSHHRSEPREHQERIERARLQRDRARARARRAA